MWKQRCACGAALCTSCTLKRPPPPSIPVLACAGLKDGEAVPEPAVPLLRDIVGGAFPEAPAAAVEAAVSGRASRAVTYS